MFLSNEYIESIIKYKEFASSQAKFSFKKRLLQRSFKKDSAVDLLYSALLTELKKSKDQSALSTEPDLQNPRNNKRTTIQECGKIMIVEI